MQVTTSKNGANGQHAGVNGAQAAELVFTGERFVEGSGVEITYDHWVRYHFACQFADKKRVLDVASGEGYGSALLSGVAAKVDGFDLDATAVAHARRKYVSERLSYSCSTMDEFMRKADPATYDVVTSFEFIEHVDDAGQQHLLEGIKRVLVPGGVAIISTPDKRLYSDVTQHRNEFHIRELYRHEFEALLKRHFQYVYMFEQATFTGSAVIRSGATRANLVQMNWEDIIKLLGKATPGVEMEGKYIVAVMSDKPLDLRAVESALLVDPARKLIGEENYQLQTQLDRLKQREHELTERASASETTLRLHKAASNGPAPEAQPAPMPQSGQEVERLRQRELQLLSEIDNLKREFGTVSQRLTRFAESAVRPTSEKEVDFAVRLQATVEPMAALLQSATTELASLRSRVASAEDRAAEATERLKIHEQLAENVLRLVEKKQKEVERLGRAEAVVLETEQQLHTMREHLHAERHLRLYYENMLSMRLIQTVKPLWDRTPFLRDGVKLAAKLVLRRR